jgi:hypothetical protein
LQGCFPVAFWQVASTKDCLATRALVSRFTRGAIGAKSHVFDSGDGLIVKRLTE